MRTLTIASGIALAVIMVGASVYVSTYDKTDSVLPRGVKHLTKSYGEDVSLRQHGLYGVDLVSCRKIRIAKRKIGFVSLGCFNELLVDDLKVTVPSRGLDKVMVKKDDASAEDSRDLSPRDVLKDLGLPKVSGVRISGLQIFTLDAQTNSELRVVAREAVSTLKGLELHDCDVIENAVTTHVASARLAYDGCVKVSWQSGNMNF